MSYNVPVLKVRQYSADELFEKHLFFLIPFHIFVYEKDFNEIEQNDEKLKKLEKLNTHTLQSILTRRATPVFFQNTQKQQFLRCPARL